MNTPPTFLDGCQDISFYLGNRCNFDCSYCDRDYIEDVIGGQHLTTADIPLIINFLKEIKASTNPPTMFSFHGGEPFTYVKIMDKIMSAVVVLVPGTYPFFIQTNGSQILQHRWFFEKWGARLTISISYDFLYQDINRTMFGIDPTLKMMKACGVTNIQFQYVIPIHDPRAFSLVAVKAITDVCFKNGIRHINLIPLRHIRGKDKFRVILTEIDIPQFADAFIKFIHILYTMGIDVVVDGHGVDLDKHYFDNHKQLILSPDGYIYPEYDFLEYKRTEATVGMWKDTVSLTRSTTKEDTLLYPQCINCSSRGVCGLKFLHRLFDEEPAQAKCVEFYQVMEVIIKHTQKLRQKHNFFEWVGI